ncbi:DUF624 domain-containing protein [Peribacillus sp. FSL H8-0477]|uniref:DUF624 domain-containing protein n=1 Tax=Peribacillus sp. FSL H8-0477 TaxID=2921388 RepID=UPI0030F73EC9
MESKQEFGQGILYTITNYIYWLFLSNIYFILANSIFLFFFMTLQQSFSNIILYFLALIPTGPAISALYYSMEKLIRTKELSPTKDFFEGYKKNLKDTLLLWIPILSVFFILLVDFQYLQGSNQILANVMLLLMIIGATLTMNILAINTRFKFRIRDIYKLAVYYSFNKFKNTIGGMFIIFLVGVLTVLTTNFLILFISSIVAYLLIVNAKGMLNDIESNFLKTSQAIQTGRQ